MPKKKSKSKSKKKGINRVLVSDSQVSAWEKKIRDDAFARGKWTFDQWEPEALKFEKEEPAFSYSIRRHKPLEPTPISAGWYYMMGNEETPQSMTVKFTVPKEIFSRNLAEGVPFFMDIKKIRKAMKLTKKEMNRFTELMYRDLKKAYPSWVFRLEYERQDLVAFYGKVK